jgi:hypothetical protein
MMCSDAANIMISIEHYREYLDLKERLFFHQVIHIVQSLTSTMQIGKVGLLDICLCIHYFQEEKWKPLVIAV